LFINVYRDKAASVGLSPADVIQQAVAAMNSSISIDRNFWIDAQTGNQYFVAVQYPEDPSMTMADLLNVEAKGTNQKYPVKLSSIAEFKRSKGAVEINHDSLDPVFNVQLNLENRDIGHVGSEIQQALKGLKPPSGTHWETNSEGVAKLVKDNHNDEAPPPGKHWERSRDGTVQLVEDKLGELAYSEGLRWKMRGEYERMNESFANLALGLAGAAVLVYLLQVALFRSWVGPFIIMFTVPLGLIGVLTMLFVTHTTLNVQSEMGVIFLVGIAVNNGVLLVEFANKQRKAGHNVRAAITTAAAIRFRPILMTFLATFLDLIPMAIGLERGSEANVPLARAVVGGLLTSTCLTFFVVPIMYTLLIKDEPDRDMDIEAELADEPAHAASALAVAGTNLSIQRGGPDT
jgi:multidrug efflux pump subunit AcrB